MVEGVFHDLDISLNCVLYHWSKTKEHFARLENGRLVSSEFFENWSNAYRVLDAIGTRYVPLSKCLHCQSLQFVLWRVSRATLSFLSTPSDDGDTNVRNWKGSGGNKSDIIIMSLASGTFLRCRSVDWFVSFILTWSIAIWSAIRGYDAYGVFVHVDASGKIGCSDFIYHRYY